MTNNGFALVLEDVRKDYKVKGRTDPVRALRGASMKVENGSRAINSAYFPLFSRRNDASSSGSSPPSGPRATAQE